MYCIVHCREKQDLCRLFAYQQSEISHFTKNNQIHLLLRAGGLPDLFCNWNGPSAVDHQLRDLPHMGTLHCHLHNYRYMAPPCQGPSTQRSSPHWPMDHQPQNIFYIQKGGITRHKVKDDNTSDAPMLHLYTWSTPPRGAPDITVMFTSGIH